MTHTHAPFKACAGHRRRALRCQEWLQVWHQRILPLLLLKAAAVEQQYGPLGNIDQGRIVDCCCCCIPAAAIAANGVLQQLLQHLRELEGRECVCVCEQDK